MAVKIRHENGLLLLVEELQDGFVERTRQLLHGMKCQAASFACPLNLLVGHLLTASCNQLVVVQPPVTQKGINGLDPVVACRFVMHAADVSVLVPKYRYKMKHSAC